MLVAQSRERAFRWLQIGAGLGAFVTALTVWLVQPRPDFTGVLMACAALPFVLVGFGVRLPRFALVLVVIPCGIFALLGGTQQSAVLPAMALVLTVPTVSRRAGIVAAALSMVTYLAVAVARMEFMWVAVALGTIAAWAGGIAFSELFDRVYDLRAASLTAAQEAVRGERRRLARELHDLVAHALTGTMLHLTEIRLVLETDPVQARRALDDAERLARASLADLRGTVRLLSEADDPALEPPIELAADIVELLDGYRRAGVDVAFHSMGEPLALSVTSAWCVYRVVQESLTNAARHAPGAAVAVQSEWGRDGVSVRIRSGVAEPHRMADDSRESRGRGQGIVGMAERVRLVGGRFSAGPTSTGWLVTGWVPVAPADMVTTL